MKRGSAPPGMSSGESPHCAHNHCENHLHSGRCDEANRLVDIKREVNMQRAVIGVAFLALVSAVPMQHARAQTGRTSKGGTGSGTPGDSARYAIAAAKANPPCEGGRLHAANTGASVTGSPGGMGSPDQNAPVPPEHISKRQAKADSAKAARDSIPNCMTISDSLRQARKDSIARARK
jgi:hypothetical protein